MRMQAPSMPNPSASAEAASAVRRKVPSCVFYLTVYFVPNQSMLYLSAVASGDEHQQRLCRRPASDEEGIAATVHGEAQAGRAAARRTVGRMAEREESGGRGTSGGGQDGEESGGRGDQGMGSRWGGEQDSLVPRVMVCTDTEKSAPKKDVYRLFAEKVRDNKQLESRWAIMRETRVEYFRGKDFTTFIKNHPEVREILGPDKDLEVEDIVNTLLTKNLVIRCDRVMKTLRPGKKKLSSWPAHLEIHNVSVML
ncbi:hypothetical protein BAE44_0003605, partial [Dichanthelium oligosanthes]